MRKLTEKECLLKDKLVNFDSSNWLEPYTGNNKIRKCKCPICNSTEWYPTPTSIWNNNIKHCVKCNIKKQPYTQQQAEQRSLDCGIKLIGIYYNQLTYTEFECPICNNLFKAKPTNIWNKKQISCNKCKKQKLHNIHYRGSKDISGKYWSTCIRGAQKRNLEFNISINYAQDLLEKQNYKCALSGLSINGSQNLDKNYSTYKEMTASLDRIDSSKGYIIGNIQWVHKDINFIKQNLSEKYFIELCKKVSEYNKL